MKGPGRWELALLRWLLPAGPVGDAMLGDLLEDVEREARDGRPRRARLQLWRSVVEVVVSWRTDAARGWMTRMVDRRGGGAMGWQGLRITARGLRRDPGYTAAVVVTMAVVVAANAAVFSVLFGVLYRPLPYESPDRVIQLWTSNTERGVERWGVSLHDARDWREAASSFSDLGAYVGRQGNLETDTEPLRVGYALTQPGVFRALGVAPALGRLFHDDEDRPGGDTGVVLSHGFWTSAYGGDPDVVGRTLVLDGAARDIVGVMPEGFYFPGPTTQLWKPFGMDPADEGSRGGRWVSAVGRLAPGVTLDEARAEMAAVGANLARAYPDTNDGMGTFVERRHEFVSSGTSNLLWTTLGVVALITLIACANVANLTLARTSRRRTELAVRASLGAGRWQLARQLWTEALLLAGVGGTLGWIFAAGLVKWLRSAEGTGLPRLAEVTLGPEAVVYTLAVTIVCCVLFGALPGVGASRAEQLAGSGSGRSRRGTRLRDGLVVAELGLCLAVLVGAGLLVRSFQAMAEVDPGFETTNRLAVRVSPSWTEYPEREDAVALYRDFTDRISGLSGVESVALVNDLPLRGVSRWSTQAFTASTLSDSPRERPSVLYRTATPGYFRTMGMTMRAGRAFEPSDGAGAEPVAVLSETAASGLWPGEDPLGRELWFVPEDHPAHEKIRVVGVVGDVRDVTAAQAPSGLVYLPFDQAAWGHFQDWGMSVVIHARTDPLGLVAGVRSALRDADPGLPLFEIETLTARAASDLAPPRFHASVIGGLGLVGWLLAGVGVFGVMSYVVGQRTREIGMRMALGSTRQAVAGLFLSRSLRLSLLGLVVGWGGALLVGRRLEALLFGVEPSDPATFLVVAGTLMATAFVACLVPALRASAVDPARCLRDD